jgi:hypothetical protein
MKITDKISSMLGREEEEASDIKLRYLSKTDVFCCSPQIIHPDWFLSF